MRLDWILLIALLEIVGGVAGLAVWPHATARSGLSVLAVLFPLPFMLSVVAGLLLWWRREVGKRFSRLVQVLQIPVFAVGPLSYDFVSGVQLGLSLGWPSLSVLSFLGGKLEVNIDHEGLGIGVNFAAIWAYRVVGRPAEPIERHDSLEPVE